MSKNTKTKYVCMDEYEGGTVGTIEEILEWQYDNGVPFSRPEYYLLGESVSISDLFKE